MKEIFYLDYAATSWPKAPGVEAAMAAAVRGMGSPNRSGHELSRNGLNLVDRVRSQLASFVGITEREHVIFTPGATYAINLAVKGLGLRDRDHVLSTCFDHNAVLRPLEQLRRQFGVKSTIVRCTETNDRLVDAVRASMRPQTKLVTINHASNVTGAVLPLKALIALAHSHGIAVLIDACQSIGHLPLSTEKLEADMIAFGGHKGLLGPPGVGCLVVKNSHLKLIPDITGGTGHNSRKLEPETVYPTSFEPGTLNVPAIAGLGAALDFFKQIDVSAEKSRLETLRSYCIERLAVLPRVNVHFPHGPAVPIVSFIVEGMSSDRVSTVLNDQYQIAVRSGLHCAPLLHEALGTAQNGSIRVSFGLKSDFTAVDALVAALKELT